MTIKHPFGPLYSSHSRILILGSFPSVKSREQNFFYGHPQNRFWKVIAAVFDAPVPETVEEKKTLILSNDLALWDSIASCEITGSSDASIRNAKANDISIILDNCDIEAIYCNGRKSHELYRKYIEPDTGREAVCLPSTSPANAQWSFERLTEAWSVIKTGKNQVRFDEVWAVEAERIEAFFRDTGGTAEVIPMPERMIGNFIFPQTRVVITGDDAEEIHRQFILRFASAGG